MAESYSNQKKTLWEKEELLVTSNFSFSQCFQKACFPEASKGVIGLNSNTCVYAQILMKNVILPHKQ